MGKKRYRPHWGYCVPYNVYLRSLQEDAKTAEEKIEIKKKFEKTYTAKLTKELDGECPSPAAFYQMLEREEKEGLIGVINVLIMEYKYWMTSASIGKLRGEKVGRKKGISRVENKAIPQWGGYNPYDVIVEALQEDGETPQEKGAIKRKFDRTYTARLIEEIGVESNHPADIFMMLKMEEKGGIRGFFNACINLYPDWISDENLEKLDRLLHKK